MKFRRTPKQSAGDRLPAFLDTACIGEACPNFIGSQCENPEMEWMYADGPRAGEGTEPPLRAETNYIMYGQRCLAGAAPDLVAMRVEVYRPEIVSMPKIVAITGMYGDMPVQIISDSLTAQIDTIGTSE